METVKEDYVSIETAKLLKEKGFDGECSRFYMPNGHGMWKYEHYHEFDISDRIECPTLQMAMKWLREVYNLHCVVNYDFILGWYCQITNLKETIEYDYEEMKHYHPENDNGFTSSEEAYEAAIKYCLENLI